MEEVRSYSRFEECLMLLIAKFFSEEKDIEKFSEWFEKITKTTTKLKEEKQYETYPYRSTDMWCNYCDYRDRDLKEEVEEC